LEKAGRPAQRLTTPAPDAGFLHAAKGLDRSRTRVVLPNNSQLPLQILVQHGMIRFQDNRTGTKRVGMWAPLRESEIYVPLPSSRVSCCPETLKLRDAGLSVTHPSPAVFWSALVGLPPNWARASHPEEAETLAQSGVCPSVQFSLSGATAPPFAPHSPPHTPLGGRLERVLQDRQHVLRPCPLCSRDLVECTGGAGNGERGARVQPQALLVGSLELRRGCG